jgi:uncharacterized protein YndB with AHSA1/START domain
MFVNILLSILAVVAILIVVVLLIASTKPSTLHVERSAEITAPPEAIFPLINDFHQWTRWSPYEERDPNLKRTYSGPESGLGSVYEWDGDSNVGQGRMEILESTPSSRILIKLDFIRPFEGHNQAQFTLEPVGDKTKVTWTMDGPANFLSKIMSVFLNFDTMIGTDFENGLAKLGSAVSAK